MSKLQQDFIELTKENQQLKDQNTAKRVLVNQMVGRIKDLESEVRDLETQNFRLKNRVRVINEHKQDTDRSRRESSMMLEELYQNAMNRFEQLQVENNKTKMQLHKLAAEKGGSNSDADCPMKIEEYEDILRYYEMATANFLRILDRYYKALERKCGCVTPSPPKTFNTTTEPSRGHNSCPPPPRLNQSNVTVVVPGSTQRGCDKPLSTSCPMKKDKLCAVLNQRSPSCNNNKSSSEVPSNVSTRGSTLPRTSKSSLVCPVKTPTRFYDDIYKPAEDDDKGSDQEEGSSG